MIKGIVIGAVIMYLLGAVEGLDEYLYNPFWCKFKVVNERLSKEEKIKFVNCLKNKDEKKRMIEYFEL